MGELETLSPNRNKEGPNHTETTQPLSDDRKLALKKLKSMGYTNMIATTALDAINDYAPNNTAMAVEWIMDNPNKVPNDGNKTTTTITKTMPPKAVSDLMSGPNTKRKIGPMEVDDTNGEDMDYKEKCNDCMVSTKIFCGDCCENTSNRYNNMSRIEKRIFWGVWIFFCCFGILLILIPVSIRKVEFDEYAIKYNDLTKTEDSKEY